MSQIIEIDPRERTVTRKEVPDLYQALRKAVAPRPFCIGHRFASGDVLYIDDEGLLKAAPAFFTLPGLVQPLAGIGIITGADDPDGEGTLPLRENPLAIALAIKWLTHEDFTSWALAQRHAVMQFTNLKTGKTTNLMAWSDVIDQTKPEG